MKNALRHAALAALAASVLIGCTSNGNKTSDVSSSGTQPGEIVLGCISPFTGTNADYGNQTKRGAELAVDEINAGGGIKGKKLRFVYEDDQGLAKNGPTALQKLASIDKVPAVLGPFQSTVVIPTAKTAEQLHVVILSASATADSIKDAGDYTFRIVPPNARQGQTAASFAKDVLHAKRAAIMPINDDYGKSIAAAFARSFTSGGGTIVDQEPFNAGTRDFRTLLTKVAASSPDVVFFPGNYEETGTLLKQAKQLSVQGAFLGSDSQMSPEFLKLAGSAAEGTFYTNIGMGRKTTDPLIKGFRTAFQKKYGGDPTTFEAYAYDAVMVLANAVKVSDGTADGIKAALYNTKNFAGVTGPISFDSFGEVDRDFAVEKVTNGQFSEVDRAGN